MGETITGKALFDWCCAGRSAAMLRRRPAALFLPGIAAHQLPLRDDVTAHFLVELVAFRPSLKIQRLIERVNLEIVTMRPRGWFRPAITQSRISVCSLHTPYSVSF